MAGGGGSVTGCGDGGGDVMVWGNGWGFVGDGAVWGSVCV